jgi:MAF protein
VDVDEDPVEGESAASLASRLALAKGRLASEHVPADAWLIAADTVVRDGEEILGKPADRIQAWNMLCALQGREHEVLTALAVRPPMESDLRVEVCHTLVPMRDLSVEDIEAYVDTGSPLDKAGAYGIQDDGFQVVDLDRMHGCFANVMGLPLCRVIAALKSAGYEPPNIAASLCSFEGSGRCAIPGLLKKEGM